MAETTKRGPGRPRKDEPRADELREAKNAVKEQQKQEPDVSPEESIVTENRKDPVKDGRPHPEADVKAKGRPEGTQPEPPSALVEELDILGPGRLPTDHSGPRRYKEHWNANPEQLLTQQGPNQPPENFPEGSAERMAAEAEKQGEEERKRATKESEEGEAEQYRRDPRLRKVHEENVRMIEEIEEAGHKERMNAQKESEKGERMQDEKTPEQKRFNDRQLEIQRQIEILQDLQRKAAERESNETPQPLETNFRFEETDEEKAARAKAATAKKPKLVEVELKRKYAPVSWEDPETGEMQSQQAEVMRTLPEGTVVKVPEKEAQRILHTNGIAVPTKQTFA